MSHSLKQQLIICDGNKGGVGKSFVATTTASLLMNQGKSITLIEADKTNPDVARRFADFAPVLLADISDRDGWISLLEALETIDTDYIIMSMPAGMNEIEAIQGLLHRTLDVLGIELCLLFCLSRQVDSIDLIQKSQVNGLASFAHRAVALKNGFFGDDEKFDRWYESNIRDLWLKQGFTEYYLPELNHRLVDYLEIQPQPLHKLADKGVSVALRLDLQDWLKGVQHSLSEILIPSDDLVATAGE